MYVNALEGGKKSDAHGDKQRRMQGHLGNKADEVRSAVTCQCTTLLFYLGKGKPKSKPEP